MPNHSTISKMRALEHHLEKVLLANNAACNSLIRMDYRKVDFLTATQGQKHCPIQTKTNQYRPIQPIEKRLACKAFLCDENTERANKQRSDCRGHSRQIPGRVPA